jgi:hypothetical protein
MRSRGAECDSKHILSANNQARIFNCTKNTFGSLRKLEMKDISSEDQFVERFWTSFSEEKLADLPCSQCMTPLEEPMAELHDFRKHGRRRNMIQGPYRKIFGAE